MSDYRSRKDMDMTVEDIHGNWWGIVKDGRKKRYYHQVWDRDGGWVLLTAQKVRQVPSSIIESLDDPSEEMVEIHRSLREDNPEFVTISTEQFDALKPGDRLWMGVSSGWGESAEREFEVGRSSYSKKYDVRSKRLYPIRDGKPHKKGVKWTLMKRGSGHVGLAQGDMAALVKSFRMEGEQAANPATMGSDDFVKAVREKADLGDGYLVTSTHNKYSDSYDSAHIAFYNVPKEIGRGGGGAVAMNNRLLMFVDGFGKGENEPPPKGKVKFRVGAAELLPREMRPRGKTASPERMVDYVAKIITEASKLEPKLPPGSRAANPAPVRANDLVRRLRF